MLIHINLVNKTAIVIIYRAALRTHERILYCTLDSVVFYRGNRNTFMQTFQWQNQEDNGRYSREETDLFFTSQ